MRENLEFQEEQKALRRQGVTGSEIAAVSGLSPWKGVHDVWAEKLGFTEEPEINEAMERGIFLEGGIIRWAGHRLDLPLVRTRETVRSEKHELVLATPDGFELDRPEGDRVAIVEVKSPGLGTAGDWAHPDDMPDGIPRYYLPQVVWEQAAAGLVDKPALVAALLGGKIRMYRVPWDEELFTLLLDRAKDFWGYVQRREPPPVGSNPAALRWLKERYNKQVGEELIEVEPGDEDRYLELASEHEYLGEVIKQTKNKRDVLQAKLIAMIQDKAGVRGRNWRVTWRQDASGKVNWKNVAQELGATEELIAKHTGEPVRRFLVKIDKEEGANG